MNATGELNSDYGKSDDERMRVMEQGLAVIGEKVDALTEGAAAVVTRLEAGSETMEGIKTDVKLIQQTLDAQPDGIVKKVERHETEIRELRDDVQQRQGRRDWFRSPLTVGILMFLLGIGLTVVRSEFQSTVDKTDALCPTKFQSLDSARARGAYSQSEYNEQLKTLVSQGCNR